MQLEGSCHCGAVRFRLDSSSPYPYQRCYCSICRKTQGGGGYAINLGGDSATLEVEGREHVSIYHARMSDAPDAEISAMERHFCSKCGSALWVYAEEWPELVHPFASAIDTPLPEPPTVTHIFEASRPAWVRIEQVSATDRHFDDYPDESLAEWHARLGPPS